MQSEQPDAVILAAAKVGGIHANNAYPADFIYQNLIIQINMINVSHILSLSLIMLKNLHLGYIIHDIYHINN